MSFRGLLEQCCAEASTINGLCLFACCVLYTLNSKWFNVFTQVTYVFAHVVRDVCHPLPRVLWHNSGTTLLKCERNYAFWGHNFG